MMAGPHPQPHNLRLPAPRLQGRHLPLHGLHSRHAGHAPLVCSAQARRDGPARVRGPHDQRALRPAGAGQCVAVRCRGGGVCAEGDGEGVSVEGDPGLSSSWCCCE